ncbi:MAG TPA: YceK/YidQ family lipoprotein [Gemmataceae bacterium]|nr:YceK/YidQ family lipoprotein [Gemmataceae bacterium]
MAKRIMCVVLCAGAAICSGCGTLMNTAWLIPPEGGQRVYGGVRVDWNCIAEEQWRSAWFRAILVADLPFSLIADTLTLPYVVALALTTDEQGGAARPKMSQIVHESFTSGQPREGMGTAKDNDESTMGGYDRLNGNIGP